jgi:oxygen-independent coproporphyrinogen-3 oxidase
VYSLILEEDTPLHKLVTSGQLKLPKEEKTLGMYNYTRKFLKENGFERYEVSNFAKDGYECQHNLHTWKMHEYIGIGAGAYGYIDGVRYGNVEQIEDYISAVSTGSKPIKLEESISSNELFEETIMLGLRTKYGVNLKDIKEKFNIDLYETKKNELNSFLKMGVIEIKNDNLVLTDAGYPILNKIILELVY